MDTIEFSTSNRGRPIVIRRGHIYNLERETDIKTFWRCNFFYKTKCKCRLETIGSTVLKSLKAHNHLAETEISEKQKAYADLKKRAAICKNQPPGCLIATFSMELEEHVLQQLNTPRKLFTIREERNFRLYQMT